MEKYKPRVVKGNLKAKKTSFQASSRTQQIMRALLPPLDSGASSSSEDEETHIVKGKPNDRHSRSKGELISIPTDDLKVSLADINREIITTRKQNLHVITVPPPEIANSVVNEIGLSVQNLETSDFLIPNYNADVVDALDKDLNAAINLELGLDEQFDMSFGTRDSLEQSNEIAIVQCNDQKTHNINDFDQSIQENSSIAVNNFPESSSSIDNSLSINL